MSIELLGFLGFVFAAASLAAIAYERRMDVLYGSHLESRTCRIQTQSTVRLWVPSIIDRLQWKARSVVYLASVIAC
jgi:hypothetical protein